jgi:hypothetical protein
MQADRAWLGESRHRGVDAGSHGDGVGGVADDITGKAPTHRVNAAVYVEVALLPR